MPSNLFFSEHIQGENILLNQEEGQHLIKVLRHKKGDEVHVTDGKGFLYISVVENENFRNCTLRITQKTKKEKEVKREVHLVVAPTKNIHRIEWLVEKSVEMGVSRISFIKTEKTEKLKLNMERLQKIAVSAIKQSFDYHLPVMDELITLPEFIKQISDSRIFVAHCFPSEKKKELSTLINEGLKEATVLIGPEGDFTKEEVEMLCAKGAVEVSLGNKRLRTESAALVAATLLCYA